jgi:hypothetical protein
MTGRLRGLWDWKNFLQLSAQLSEVGAQAQHFGLGGVSNAGNPIDFVVDSVEALVDFLKSGEHLLFKLFNSGLEPLFESDDPLKDSLDRGLGCHVISHGSSSC